MCQWDANSEINCRSWRYFYKKSVALLKHSHNETVDFIRRTKISNHNSKTMSSID